MDKFFREAKTCSISPFEEKMKSRRKKRKASEVTTKHGTGRGGGRSDGGRGGGRGDGGRGGGHVLHSLDVVVDAVTEDVAVDAVVHS